MRISESPVNVTLPTSEPVTVPLGICTRCGYPGPTGMKCANPRGCERVADPFAAFIGHARVEGARLALEAAKRVAAREAASWEGESDQSNGGNAARRIEDAIRALDPAAIVKP